MSCISALSIDVNKTGDPREFLVDILRKDFPELQIFFGFGVSTESMYSFHTPL